MIDEIFNTLRNRRYYSSTIDKRIIKKVALEWAIENGGDIDKTLSTETINAVLALVAEDCLVM